MHKQLKLFLIANSLFLLAAGMLGPLYALFVKDIGGDILVVGASWSIFMIVSGLGIFLMGRIQDNIKKDKSFIIVGYGLMSLGFLGYFFMNNNSKVNISYTDKISIKKSLIPNSGRGVFANKDFKQDEIIEVCPLITDYKKNFENSKIKDYTFKSKFIIYFVN